MEKELLKDLLVKAWDIDTSLDNTNNILGQMVPTVLVVQDMIGGDIIRTQIDEQWHFYNMLEGERYDYISDAMGEKIDYEDILTDRDDLLEIDNSFEKYAKLKQKVIKLFKETVLNKN